MVAPEFTGPQFEEYLDYLRPIAAKMARKRAQPHACLGREDLLSQALEACLWVWRRHRRRCPDVAPELLYPMAVRAMSCHLRKAYRIATKFGEAEVRIVPLDAPVRPGVSRRSVADVLGAPIPNDPVEVGVVFPADTIEVLRPLTDREESLLRELVSPSPFLLGACLDRWVSPERGRRNWPTVRAEALSSTLGWAPSLVRVTYRTLRRALSVRGRSSGEAGYPVVRRAYTMDEVGSAPVGPSPAVPVVEGHVTPQPGETKKSRARKSKPKEVKSSPGPTLKVGTNVRYKGGSRAKGIVAGQRGVIKAMWPNKVAGHLYVVRFGKGKKEFRTCAVASRYVAAV